MNPLVIAEIAKAAGGITGAATGAAASALTPGAKEERADYRSMVKRLGSGTLGPTQAEKQGVVSNALNPLRSNIMGANAELARALAAGGDIRAAQQAAAAQQQNLASGSAQAAAGAEQWASQEQARRKAEILGRIKEKQEKNAATWNAIGGGALAGTSGQTSPSPLSADDVISKTAK